MGEFEDEDLSIQLLKIIEEQNVTVRNKEFNKWCAALETIAADTKRVPKDGLIADIELQPYRWIQHALDLLGSRRAAGTIQLSNGLEGPDLRAYLPYPVFQMGAEIFLKGMWLYNDPRCNRVTSETYVAPAVREEIFKGVKGLSHDLLEILRVVKTLNVYQRDPHLTKFLLRVEGIVRYYYHPLFSGGASWANERYPKRFYCDAKNVGRADAFKSYPNHWMIDRLFTDAADKLDKMWREDE